MSLPFSKISLLAIFCLILANVNAQTPDPVLLNVAGETVTRGEFLKVYQKNNTKEEALDRQSLEEYLDLYINFRLKVKEATSLGMDTMKSFRDELQSYRKQLAQPYLTDADMTDKLVKEAYERKKFDVRASHILVRVDRAASDADTLAAWNKIMQLRKRIMKGEDFAKVAEESSEDPSVKDRTQDGRSMKGNKGDLGYFAVFDMVYPFESAVYNLKVGDVSMPVRTDFGYHLIRVTNRLQALGKVQLAHIMLAFPANATLDDSLKVADSANIAYQQIMSGTDFGAVAKKFSDDKSTSDKGGVLPWFGVNRLLPEFIENIDKLKEKDDCSEPFQTAYGWHIIKLVDRKTSGKFDDEKEEIKQRIPKNDRSSEVVRSFVNKARNNFGFTLNQPALDEMNTIVTDSIFAASWKVPADRDLSKTICVLGTKKYIQADFAAFLVTAQRKTTKHDMAAYLRYQFNEFLNQNVIRYADSQLENEYPEFKALIGEYHDGILLFDLTDRKVWTKAVKDTAGLDKFYDANKTKYMWDQRLDASLFTLKDAKAGKKLVKMLRKGTADEAILASLNKDSIPAVSLDRKKFVKGDNRDVDAIEWKKGVYGPFPAENDWNLYIRVNSIVEPEPKLFAEIKGLITADYQNYLEKQWIGELRAKYPFSYDKDVFNSIFSSN